MSSKPHVRKQTRSRIPVRVGALEATLAHFRAELLNEIGAKTALLLERYDKLKVAPLRERLDWLELPLYRRAWIRAGRAWSWLRSKLRRPPASPVASAPGSPSEMPAA